MATLTFLGAAQEVTGSCHLLESKQLGKALLDCGMHQGGDAVKRVAKEHFLFEASTINAVILSHAHLDHSGLLPKLVHDGFDGPIYCTQATAELLDIMLHDAVGIYERDLENKNRRHSRKGLQKLAPQYDRSDVEKVLKLCKPYPYNSTFPINKHTSVTFHDAGHILGSAIVEIQLTEADQTKTLVFSGDLGKRDTVLMNDPTLLNRADIVMMEGTYGNREHRSMDDTLEQFVDILHRSWENGGNVLIPAFAVGRTQEFLFYLGKLYQQGRLDDWQIFLDSPMAIKVTNLYDRWLHTLDTDGIKELGEKEKSLLNDFIPKLHLSLTPEESIAINKIKNGAIIIAGSGMCTGGRIKHHFKQRIWNEKNTIVFVGFQAQGTLGRFLVDGAEHITLFNEKVVVKAKIETLGGFSAHAGQSGLIEWAAAFVNEPKLVLVHGEAKALDTLSQKLWDDKNIRATIPTQGQSIAF